MFIYCEVFIVRVDVRNSFGFYCVSVGKTKVLGWMRFD